MPSINNDSSLISSLNYEYQGHAWAVMKNICIRRDIMDSIFRLLEKFFSKTSKLLAIRLELKMQQGTDNNQPISRFCRQFKSTLIQHYGPCYHGYIWVREKARSTAQHYHLALLLDGQRVKHSDNVYRLAKAEWTHGYLALPMNPFYFVHRDHLDEHRLLVYRLSYLAKTKDKGKRPAAVKDYQVSRSIRKQ